MSVEPLSELWGALTTACLLPYPPTRTRSRPRSIYFVSSKRRCPSQPPRETDRVLAQNDDFFMVAPLTPASFYTHRACATPYPRSCDR